MQLVAKVNHLTLIDGVLAKNVVQDVSKFPPQKHFDKMSGMGFRSERITSLPFSEVNFS